MRTTKDEREKWLPELTLKAADMEEAEFNDIIEFARRLIADVDEARELLREYEQWEADLILDSGAWRTDPPVLTEALQDSFIALQTKRNALLKEPSDA